MQEILVEAADTPNRVGVWKNEEHIYAITGCCGAGLRWNSSSGCLVCSFCETHFTLGTSVESLSLNTHKPASIYMMIQQWTGLKQHDFKLEITYPSGHRYNPNLPGAGVDYREIFE
jgi:hypothetical protein